MELLCRAKIKELRTAKAVEEGALCKSKKQTVEQAAAASARLYEQAKLAEDKKAAFRKHEADELTKRQTKKQVPRLICSAFLSVSVPHCAASPRVSLPRRLLSLSCCLNASMRRLPLLPCCLTAPSR